MIVIIYSFSLLVIAVVNIKLKLIVIPSTEEMISRQIDYITISTVFAGFSFTALGLLLGLSSEKLIEKIKNTNIILDKVNRIIGSIVYFILSVIASLFFVLGLNSVLASDKYMQIIVDSILYVFSVGYLVGGLVCFVYAVYELYDLIKRIYGYNKKEINKNIVMAKAELQATKKKMREAEEKN